MKQSSNVPTNQLGSQNFTLSSEVGGKEAEISFNTRFQDTSNCCETIVRTGTRNLPNSLIVEKYCETKTVPLIGSVLALIIIW